jgi:8-oxo-dGTP diphosphatase
MSLGGQRLDAGRYQVVVRTLVFGWRDGRVLLQQVPAERGPWAGLWNGIGGHVERGESAAEAARREFLEETGLELLDLKLAGQVLVDLGTSPGITFSVFCALVADGEPTPSEEGPLRWFAPDDIPPEILVEDLPTLLPRALACLDGAPPFSAIYTYGEDGGLTIRMD